MKSLLALSIAIGLIAIPSLASAEAVVLGCKVTGPYDVRIANTSGAELAAGIKIKWTVDQPHAAGKVTLDDPLAPGGSLALVGALIVGPKAGTPCSAVALGV